MYFYIKAVHIIFIVTWFAGLFYLPRLLIYNTEAESKSEPEKNILHQQFNVMIRLLWYVITWPSAILTLIFGGATWYLLGILPMWLSIKLGFVVCLYAYHFSLHLLVKQELKGVFKYSSMQLRIWNEVATIILVACVMLAVVKESISVVWGITGLVLFIVLIMSAVNIYKAIRTRKK